MLTKTAKNTQTEINKNNAAAAAEGTVEVLYQKMGDRWFAFSVMDDEVFVGSISPETIAELERNERIHAGRKTGNT